MDTAKLKSMLTSELGTILKKNAPVRDGAKYPGARGSSPFPGNLKQNGIRVNILPDGCFVDVGGSDAPYAPYTETRSRKKGWQKKSAQEFAQKIQELGGRLQ